MSSYTEHGGSTKAIEAFWRILYEERAAIMQYDGNLPRELAEQYAAQDIRKQRKEHNGNHS